MYFDAYFVPRKVNQTRIMISQRLNNSNLSSPKAIRQMHLSLLYKSLHIHDTYSKASMTFQNSNLNQHFIRYIAHLSMLEWNPTWVLSLARVRILSHFRICMHTTFCMHVISTETTRWKEALKELHLVVIFTSADMPKTRI